MWGECTTLGRVNSSLPGRGGSYSLTSCTADAPDVVRVVLEGDKRVFDWERGDFYWKRSLSTLGPLEITRAD